MKEISAKDFESLISEKKTFVLHFWAEWNGYDIEQKQFIEVLAKESNTVTFYQMNVDIKDNWGLCKLHNVMGPPTIVFYLNGVLQERIVGVRTQQQLKDQLCTLNIV